MFRERIPERLESFHRMQSRVAEALESIDLDVMFGEAAAAVSSVTDAGATVAGSHWVVVVDDDPKQSLLAVTADGSVRFLPPGFDAASVIDEEWLEGPGAVISLPVDFGGEVDMISFLPCRDGAVFPDYDPEVPQTIDPEFLDWVEQCFEVYMERVNQLALENTLSTFYECLYAQFDEDGRKELGESVGHPRLFYLICQNYFHPAVAGATGRAIKEVKRDYSGEEEDDD